MGPPPPPPPPITPGEHQKLKDQQPATVKTGELDFVNHTSAQKVQFALKQEDTLRTWIDEMSAGSGIPTSQLRLEVGATASETARRMFRNSTPATIDEPLPIPMPSDPMQVQLEAYGRFPQVRGCIGAQLVATLVALNGCRIPASLAECVATRLCVEVVNTCPAWCFMPPPLEPPTHARLNLDGGLEARVRDGVALVFAGYNTASGFPRGAPFPLEAHLGHTTVQVAATAETTLMHFLRHVFGAAGQPVRFGYMYQQWHMLVNGEPVVSNLFGTGEVRLRDIEGLPSGATVILEVDTSVAPPPPRPCGRPFCGTLGGAMVATTSKQQGEEWGAASVAEVLQFAR